MTTQTISKEAKAYKSRSDSLINALESEDSVSQIAVFAVGIKEGSLDGDKSTTWVFTENVVKEIWKQLRRNSNTNTSVQSTD